MLPSVGVMKTKVEAILGTRGSTKRWLAKQLGMHDTQLNKYLSGALPAPDGLYERIARVLQVPVDFVAPEPKAQAAA